MNFFDIASKNLCNPTMPLEPGKPLKPAGYNYKYIMTVSATIVPAMTFMQVALIENLKLFRLKGRPQKFSHSLFHTHTTSPLLKTVLTLYNGFMPRIKLKQNSPEFADGKTIAQPKSCEMPGCRACGEHRAPRDRSLSGYYLFCLDHVREYNKAWDFFSGMNETEVENHIHSSFYGDRPTWHYGLEIKDPAEFLRHKAWQTYSYTDMEAEKENTKGANSGNTANTLTPEREALGIMGLEEPVTFAEIKNRYKVLAKKYHPDLNKGSQETEELLKRVNMAYTILKLAYRKFQKSTEQGA